MELDPLFTDEEIIQTFTPGERAVHDWVQGNYSMVMPLSFKDTIAAMKEKWPNMKDSQKTWHSYCEKWFGRGRRRRMRPVSYEELLNRIKSTNCKNPDQFGKTLWVINMSNTPDVLLGESDFGGVRTGYSMVIGAHLLFPDKTSNADKQALLDRAVLALDLESGPTLPSQNLGVDPKKRRQQNRSSGDESVASTMSSISTRSAESDDFSGREPFCFFQIGSLHRCTGDSWAKVRGSTDLDEIYDADWQDTGYGVVIKLNPQGYPTGPVYVVYNFQRLRERPVAEGNQNPFSEEIEWTDKFHTELPHIRRLYPKCPQKFFLAKIANKLQDLKHGVRFNFQVIRENRCFMFSAKRQGVQQRIIPSEIYTTNAPELKRFHASNA